MTALAAPVTIAGRPSGARRRLALPLLAYCLAGLVVATAITLFEAAHPPVVQVVGKVHTTRSGLVTTARAEVRTRLHTPQCPVIHVVADDTNSKTLAEAVAAPVTQGPLVDGRPVAYQASIRLTATDYREKLKGFQMYVYQAGGCPPVTRG